jgi:uncharacterized phage protein gp47/JayE
MPIDFSEYVYLVPFDVSPTAVYLDSIEYAKIALPEFQPRQGTPEDAILQAVSYISALNISAINRLPDRLMAGLVGMMGVEINDGSQAVIDVEFTCIDYDGTIVPQGTIVRYDYEFLGEQRSIYFETIEEGTIAAVVYTGTQALPTVTVEARAIDVGATLPIPVGTVLEIDTPTSSIVSAIVDDFVSNGTSPETTEEFLNRAVQFLGSLSSSFARASQIDGHVLSTFASTVSRCKAYDLTNSASGLEWADADEPGYVTVFVYGINSTLTIDQKSDILIDIQNRTVAGLELEVRDVNLVTLAVGIEVAYSSSYESTVVQENIETVLTNYFSPINYRFTDGIKLSEFYSIASSVPGVLYVQSLTVTPGSGGTSDGSGNVLFSKKGSLPSLTVANTAVTLVSVDE